MPSFNPDEYIKQNSGSQQGFDPDAYISSNQPKGLLATAAGYGKQALAGINSATEAVDAPFRSLLGGGGLSGAAAAYQDPTTAPTVKGLLTKYGVSDDPKAPVSSILAGAMPGAAIGLTLAKKATGMSDADLLQYPASLAQPSTAILEGIGAGASALKRNIIIKPILDSLAESKAALNPKMDAEAIKHIDSLVSDVKGPNWGGKVSRDRLGEINELLQSHASALPTQASADAANKASQTLAAIADKKPGNAMLDTVKNVASKVMPDSLYQKYVASRTMPEVIAGAGALIGHHMAPEGYGTVGAGIGGLLAPLAAKAAAPAAKAATDPKTIKALQALGLLGNVQSQGLLSR